jgi:hypothetical protein
VELPGYPGECCYAALLEGASLISCSAKAASSAKLLAGDLVDEQAEEALGQHIGDGVAHLAADE